MFIKLRYFLENWLLSVFYFYYCMAIFQKWNGSEEHYFCKWDNNHCFGLAWAIRSFDMVLFDSRFAVYQCMCTKLRTVAANNNRVHTPWSLYYCLFTPRLYIVVVRAHPVRGERNATGEVAKKYSKYLHH